MNAISKAVSQSFETASFLFIKLKSINKYNENTIAPKIALILITLLLNPIKVLIRLNIINPNRDSNKIT